MRFRDMPEGLRRVRPPRALAGEIAGGVAAFVLPLSAVLYYLTIPDGPWEVVVGFDVAVAAVAAAAWRRYLGTGFWVSREGIAERGFLWKGAYVPREEIGSIIVVESYYRGGNARAQLFVCDDEGRQLMRMRGEFWPVEQMRAVATALDIPTTTSSDEFSRDELLDEYPGLLYWFERRILLVPAITVTLIVLVGVLGGALVYAFTGG
jgi:hypothetical protein